MVAEGVPCTHYISNQHVSQHLLSSPDSCVCQSQTGYRLRDSTTQTQTPGMENRCEENGTSEEVHLNGH